MSRLIRIAFAVALACAASAAQADGYVVAPTQPPTLGPIGPKGDRGCSVLPTAGAPAVSLGTDCDFAFDVAAGQVWGPKRNGQWPGDPVTLTPIAQAQALVDAARGSTLSIESAVAAAASAQQAASAAAVALGDAAQAATAAAGSAAQAQAVIDGAHVTINGHETPINGAATIGPSDMTVTAPLAGAIPRTVADRLGDVVSGKDLGLVGDGTTDNTAAMTAIMALTTSPSVMIPAGTYRLGCTAQGLTAASAISLIGAGRSRTKFVYDSGCNFTGDVLTWNGRDGVRIADLTIDLNTPAAPTARRAVISGKAYNRDTDGFVVERVGVVNGTAPMHLVQAASAAGYKYSRVVVSNNYLTLTTATGDVANQCIALTTNAQAGYIPAGVIEGNTCVNSAIQGDGDGLIVRGNDVSGWKFGTAIFLAYSSGASAANCIVTGNYLHDGPVGLDYNTTPTGGIENNCVGAIISNNVMARLGGAGVKNFANWVTISGNRIFKVGGNWGGGADFGVRRADVAGIGLGSVAGTPATHSSQQVVITGNVITDDGTGNTLYGVAGQPSVSFSPVLRGNRITAKTQAIIFEPTDAVSADATSSRRASPSVNVTSLEWTSLDTASYKSWRLTCTGLAPSSAGTIGIQIGTGATPTWATGGSYTAQWRLSGGADTTLTIGNTTTGTAVNAIPENAILTTPGQFVAEIGDLGAAAYKPMTIRSSYLRSAGSVPASAEVSGWWAGDTTAATAIRVVTSAAAFKGACTLEGRP